MVQDKRPYKDYHPSLRTFGKVSAVAILIVSVYLASVYYDGKKKERELFLQRQQQARHILIDKIGDHKVWLIIYNGDTVGTVVTK